MYVFMVVLISPWILAVGQVPGERKESEAKAIAVVKKAMEAHGGGERLKRLVAGNYKFTGTTVGSGLGVC